MVFAWISTARLRGDKGPVRRDEISSPWRPDRDRGSALLIEPRRCRARRSEVYSVRDRHDIGRHLNLAKKPAVGFRRGLSKSCDVGIMQVICPTCQRHSFWLGGAEQRIRHATADLCCLPLWNERRLSPARDRSTRRVQILGRLSKNSTVALSEQGIATDRRQPSSDQLRLQSRAEISDWLILLRRPSRW